MATELTAAGVSDGSIQASRSGVQAGAAASPGAVSGSPSLSLTGLKRTLREPAVRRTLPAILVLVALGLFLLVYLWMVGPSYRTLFPGMVEAEQLEAVEILQGAGHKPLIDPGTGQLRVPSDRYHEARILLASRGLPRSGAVGGGFEALNEQSSMTTSQFMEQVRYNTAIEQELARSVSQISSIQAARIHLATPRQSLFVRDRTPPSASVIVTPQPGRVVSPEQVQAIVHLVSSSVPHLSAENVTVVDQMGNLVTQQAMQGGMSLSGAQLQHRMRLEESYRTRILQVLMPIVGEVNVRSQVNIDMDFTEVETTFEDYDSGGRGPRTRSEVLAEERSARLDARGIPGALANEPPENPQFVADGQAPPADDEAAGEAAGDNARAGTFSSRSTRNFELDRVLRHVRSSVGGIERVSVAVAINERTALDGEGRLAAEPYSPEEVEQLKMLVQGVVGFNEARGDQVILVRTRFEAPMSLPPIAWYENDALMANARWLALALIFVLIILFVIRPVVKHFVSPPTGEAARMAAVKDGGISPEELEMVDISESDSLDDIKKKLKHHLAARNEEAQLDTLESIKANLSPKKSSMAAEMLDTANSYDDKVALIRMLVSEDSGRVANVLKSMIKGG